MTDVDAGLRILFVCSSDLRSPSEKQVLWLSSHLAARGHRAMISMFGDPHSAESEGGERIAGVELRRHRFRGPRLSREDRVAASSFQPDLIHAWNPRVPVIAAAREYSNATGAPVFVHWEDDEWGMLGGHPTSSAMRRAARAGRRLAAHLQPSAWYQSTEASIRWAVANAVAFDALAPILGAYVVDRTGRQCAVILPTLPSLPSGPPPPAPELPRSLEGRPLVALTGALLNSRVEDLRLALRGAAVARERSAELAFVLAGRNLMEVEPEVLAREAGLSEEDFVFLDHVPYPSVPRLLERCSVLLAVSQPTELNLRCLPSKLQSYLVSGTSTVLSAHGVGELFEDRKEVLKLLDPDPDQLGGLIATVLGDPALRQTLSNGGTAAAKRLFDPERNTAMMIAHYRGSLT